MPTPAAVTYPKCPSRLSTEQVAQFHEDGFLAFEDLLTPEDVRRLRRAMREILRDLYEQARAGAATVERSDWKRMRNYSGMKITSEKNGYGVLFEPDVTVDVTADSLDDLDQKYRKLFAPCNAHPRFKALAEDARMTGILEDLLGPDPIPYGNMALCKPARIGTEKPWHQDGAYFAYAPMDGVDVWVALDDASARNGCMYVIPGAHRLGPKKHVHLDDCTIAGGRIDTSQAIPVEMRAGGVLFFSVMLPHQTPPNRSDRRRRAVQFFYRGAHTEIITRDEHIQQFVEADGTPATCSAV